MQCLRRNFHENQRVWKSTKTSTAFLFPNTKFRPTSKLRCTMYSTNYFPDLFLGNLRCRAFSFLVLTVALYEPRTDWQTEATAGQSCAIGLMTLRSVLQAPKIVPSKTSPGPPPGPTPRGPSPQHTLVAWNRRRRVRQACSITCSGRQTNRTNTDRTGQDSQASKQASKPDSQPTKPNQPTGLPSTAPRNFRNSRKHRELFGDRSIESEWNRELASSVSRASCTCHKALSPRPGFSSGDLGPGRSSILKGQYNR